MMSILTIFSIQISHIQAEKLSYLQEGLILRYEYKYIWTHAQFGKGEFSRKGNITITVLEVDRTNNMMKIKYDCSFIVNFPPGTTLTEISPVNIDGTNPTFNTHGNTQKKFWSFKSIVTLRGRIGIRIEGDRVDIMREYVLDPTSGMEFKISWGTIFPLGYPTSIFINPKTTLYDEITSYEYQGHYDPSPKIKKMTFSINRIEDLPTPFGEREILVREGVLTSQPGENQTKWRIEYLNLWDRETGILIDWSTRGATEEQIWMYNINLNKVDRIEGEESVEQIPNLYPKMGIMIVIIGTLGILTFVFLKKRHVR